MVDDDSGLFRREAVEAPAREGNVLDNPPPWTASLFWLLFAAIAVGLLYLTFGTISEYAEGPAIIRLEGRTQITAAAPGTIRRVYVDSSRPVAAGQLLLDLNAAQEDAELHRIDAEIEAQTVLLLQDLDDGDARQSLVRLRAQRRYAAERRRERSVYSPVNGVAGDVLLREGQYVQPGEHLLTVQSGDQRGTVLAFLPGRYRPLLQPGMALRLEPAGHKYSYQELQLAWVGDDVLGEQEVRRSLPSTLADTPPVPRPSIIVRATLPPSERTPDGLSYDFMSGGRPCLYHEGMQATAAVRVQREPILLRLIPALKAILENRHGD